MNYPIGSGTSNRTEDQTNKGNTYGRTGEGQSSTGTGSNTNLSGSTGTRGTTGYGGSAGIGTSVQSGTKGSQILGGTSNTGTTRGTNTTGINYLDPRLFQQAGNRYNTRADLAQQNAQRLLYGPSSWLKQSYTPPPQQTYGVGTRPPQQGNVNLNDIYSKFGLSPMQYPGNAAGLGQPQMPSNFPTFQQLIAQMGNYPAYGGVPRTANVDVSGGGVPYPGMPGSVPTWYTNPTTPPPAGGPPPGDKPPVETAPEVPEPASPNPPVQPGGTTSPAPGEQMARANAPLTLGASSAAGGGSGDLGIFDMGSTDTQGQQQSADLGNFDMSALESLGPEAQAAITQMLGGDTSGAGDGGFTAGQISGAGDGGFVPGMYDMTQYRPAEQGGGDGGLMGQIESLLGSQGYSPEELTAMKQAGADAARTGIDATQAQLARTAARTGQTGGLYGAQASLGGQLAGQLSDQARNVMLQNSQEAERRRELGGQMAQSLYGQELGAEQGATAGLAGLAGFQSGTTQETQQTQEEMQQQIQQAIENMLSQGQTTQQQQEYTQQLQQEMEQAYSRGDYARAEEIQRQLEQEQYNQSQQHGTGQAQWENQGNLGGDILSNLDLGEVISALGGALGINLGSDKQGALSQYFAGSAGAGVGGIGNIITGAVDFAQEGPLWHMYKANVPNLSWNATEAQIGEYIKAVQGGADTWVAKELAKSGLQPGTPEYETKKQELRLKAVEAQLRIEQSRGHMTASQYQKIMPALHTWAQTPGTAGGTTGGTGGGSSTGGGGVGGGPPPVGPPPNPGGDGTTGGGTSTDPRYGTMTGKFFEAYTAGLGLSDEERIQILHSYGLTPGTPEWNQIWALWNPGGPGSTTP